MQNFITYRMGHRITFVLQPINIRPLFVIPLGRILQLLIHLKTFIVALEILMIDDLFELAQLDAGGVVMSLEPQSLSDLISDTLESFRPLAERKDILIEGHVGPGLDPVTMDSRRIGRVLSNIVNNAIQHTTAGGNIELQANRVEEGVQVTVTDDGPGFSDEELPRIFEKFYRGERARCRSTGGAGLGLAIAKSIIDAHDGRIWASNADGRGAKVSFVLP